MTVDGTYIIIDSLPEAEALEKQFQNWCIANIKNYNASNGWGSIYKDPVRGKYAIKLKRKLDPFIKTLTNVVEKNKTKIRKIKSDWEVITKKRKDEQ